MISPVPSTASTPSTWWRVTPYFTARIPPALVATLPPRLAEYSPGNTGYTSPSGASERVELLERHAGLHDGHVVLSVDLEHLGHPLEVDDDAAVARDARARQTGCAPPRSDRHAELGREAHDARDLSGRRRLHDRVGQVRGRGQRLIVGVVVADRLAVQHVGDTDDLTEALDEVGHGG